MDDFGTGYSSLGYLDRLPVDVLKIDKTFIDRLAGSGEAGTALIAAILRIAQTLGLETVAEGVERPEQARQLRALGCHYAQGYLYAKPLPTVEVEELVTQPAPHRQPASPPTDSTAARRPGVALIAGHWVLLCPDARQPPSQPGPSWRPPDTAPWQPSGPPPTRHPEVTTHPPGRYATLSR